MGRITTHVLDVARGKPAAGVRIELQTAANERQLLHSTSTNADGRCDRPLLEGTGFRVGEYDLIFFVGEYFERIGLDLPRPRFLNQVVIRFGVADAAEHYHVPLLVSPWSFSTYRGS
ncbi:MAG: hydroxyisourate hydrolase [Acetobacteraceae bacterium]|nr:hydroxyisourate hydrolase [Acetobacteraceae bacterium]